MTQPAQAARERERHEEIRRSQESVEQAGTPIEALGNMVEAAGQPPVAGDRGTVNATGRPASAGTRGALSAAAMLRNSVALAANLDAAANGAPRDRTANTLRTGASAASVVSTGAGGLETLTRGSTARSLGRVARGAQGVTSALNMAATGADIYEHGATEENLSSAVEQGVGLMGPFAALGYGTAHAGGEVIRREADRASIQERMHPVQRPGRGVNGGTTTTYESGTDAAARQGALDAEEFRRQYPFMDPLVGTAVGGVSTVGHAVVNTAHGAQAAAMNSQQRPRSHGDEAALRILGVTPYTPYQLSQMPSYDIDHPPPTH